MDAVIAVAVVVAICLAFWRVGVWRWVWLSIAAVVGGWEAFAYLTTGKTISQQYWAWASTSPWWWLPALLVALGGIGLATHLVWKRLRK